MAEQTMAERMEQMHREQLHFLEKRLAELEMEHTHALEQERQDHMEQRKSMAEVFQERRQELLHQNDGMLGAIGRLHVENEALKKSVRDSEGQVIEKQEALKRMEHDVQIQGHLVALKNQDQIEILKKENLELRTRLGEKPAKGKRK